MAGIVKITDLEGGKNLVNKEELSKLRGRIFILDHENSEIAKKLEIKEKGVFGSKFR